MNNFLNSLRLRLFITLKTLGYTQTYTESFYKIYLNHNKIIHFRNGHPVYSLSTPALFSKPAANLIARSFYRSIQNKNLPNMMSFAINDDCNAACKHCSFYSGVDDKTKKELTLKEAKKVIKDAQELGVSVINFVGGEPLLREDFPQILKSVDKDLSTTVMFTNGFYLEEKARELKDAGLDSVYISIDSADSRKHDILRGKKGIFEKAITGIRTAKDVGLSVGISCCITPETYKDGEFDKVVKLAKEIGVHEVLIFDAMPTGRFKMRDDLVDNNGWIEDMIEDSKKYNDDSSYPGVLLWAYATSHRSAGCACGTSYFYVSPYGDIMPCDFNHAKFGNLREKTLYEIWDNMSNMDDFRSSKWGGCKVKDSKFRTKKTVDLGKGCAGC